MKYEKWNIAGYDRKAAVALVRAGISPIAAVVLASRGMTDVGEAEEFLSADVGGLHDPFRMLGMDKAAERVRRAIENKEHVAVYGDYDVDGMTSACLMYEFFVSHGLRCEIYIPERLEDGYGVKCAALESLAAKGVTLTVTVDCGITACAEAEFAKSLGMDLVITDHHECAQDLPCSCAVVDPKMPGDEYPFKALAGVGVAFKLICAVEGTEHTAALLDKYGDLVAVGTVADVMPVTGENRLLIKRGLERLNSGARPGLRELIRAAGAEGKELTAAGIGYSVAPRLNAAGRMGKTEESMRLLLSHDAEEAASLADGLCALNRERQATEGEMYREALEMLEKKPPEGNPIVLASKNWHQGVAGIVASRLCDKFGLPAVVICLQDGSGRGSCRSVEGFSIYSALESCAGTLETYGGHDMAAGLTVSEEMLSEFEKQLGDYYRTVGAKKPEKMLTIDAEVVKPGLLTEQNISSLKELEPFGSSNPPPILCLKDAEVSGASAMGGGKHTKMRISRWGETYECVMFQHSPEDLGIVTGGRCDIAFTPQINEFRGRRTVQLNLTDIITRH